MEVFIAEKQHRCNFDFSLIVVNITMKGLSKKPLCQTCLLTEDLSSEMGLEPEAVKQLQLQIVALTEEFFLQLINCTLLSFCFRFDLNL